MEEKAVGKVNGETHGKTRVLFLCTHNSARSQMAEGYLRHVAGERFEVSSAGTEATHVSPEAREAMAEIGIDISGQESKTLERYLGEPFDYVITVCDSAKDSCPAFPGPAERLHWSLPDPSVNRCEQAERIAVFRSVRERLQGHIEAELIHGGHLERDAVVIDGRAKKKRVPGGTRQEAV